MASGIYRIVQRDSSRTYIGSAADIERRWRQHKNDLQRGGHDNVFLQSAWDIHGCEAFDFEVVAEVPVDRLIEHEQFYIDTGDCLVELGGFNISPTAGATRGLKPSAETLARQSATRKRLAATPEGRARVMAALNAAMAPEAIAKKVAILKAKLATPEGAARLADVRAKITPEALERANAKKRGRRLSPEVCRNISAGRRFVLAAMTDEQRAAIGDKLRAALGNKCRKLTFAQAEEIRAARSAGATYKELEARFGVSRVPLHKIVNGKTYITP